MELKVPKYPPDEIPGYTIFLNQANRFRKDYEYINYWKTEKEIEKRFADADITENIVEEIHYTQLSLLDKIDELKVDIGILVDDPRLKDETERANVAEDELKILKSKVINLEDLSSETQMKLNAALIGGEKALSYTLLYGKHTLVCNYLEFLQSGRVVSELVKETLCDCEWNDIKKDTENALKVLLENRSGNNV